MPRTPLTVQRGGYTGSQVVFTAVTASNDAIAPSQGRALLVNNASASPLVITIPSNLTQDALVLPDRTVTVPAGQIWQLSFGALPKEGLQSDGTVWLNYGATATITAAYVETV